MLNTKAKNKALQRLKKRVDVYEETSELVRDEAIVLYELRHETAASVVAACEKYLSDLANAPRKLRRSVGKLKTEFASFEATITELQERSSDVAVKSGGGAGGGVAAGVGVAAFAPSGAMAIATTFGTASAGTAISSLSGAAATNAALAWLGGGTVASGAGGMAAGKMLLALAGPVGWAIGGASLIGAGGYAWYNNAKIAEEATEKASEVHEQVLILKRAHNEISDLIALTREHEDGIRKQLKYLRSEAPEDYRAFTEDGKHHLGALINNVHALAELLNREVEITTPSNSAN